MMAGWSAVTGSALLAFSLAGNPAFSAVSDPDPPQAQAPAAGMKSGRLTAKHDKAAEIDGRDYAFHSKIEFADDAGRAREWKEFRRGDYVQYHLKQGQIDFLLLELPK
jgi:hypothetical protein